MNWFYAENGQQKGPVSDSDLASLAENGSLKAETLLWREGLPDWQPVSRVRPDLVANTGAPMLSGVAVAEQHKDLLVQQLREGVIGELTAPGSVRYVGFWWRLLSWFIDYIILLVAQQIIQLVGTVIAAVLMNAGNSGGILGIIAWAGAFLFSIALNAWYHTWMVSRFGGTLGKMALGFKIVTMDGQPVRWPRALGRWAVSGVLNHLIWLIVMLVPIALIFLLGIGGMENIKNLEQSPAFVFWVIGLMVAFVVGFIGGAFPFWMAGLDKEKRALQDRICATRVVWK